MGSEIGDKPLMSYASDVAAGAGRTPVGIVLFAASHLLLGGFLLLVGWPYARHAWLRGEFGGEALFAIVVLSNAIPMTLGGVLLLWKGRLSWLASVFTQALLGITESILAAYGFGLALWCMHRQDSRASVGLTIGVVATLLLALCLVVLRYLSRAKARNTFGLPPGDSGEVVRWLPLALLIVGMFVIAIGLMIASELR